MMQFVSQIMQKGMKSGYELRKGGYEVRKILRAATQGQPSKIDLREGMRAVVPLRNTGRVSSRRVVSTDG